MFLRSLIGISFLPNASPFLNFLTGSDSPVSDASLTSRLKDSAILASAGILSPWFKTSKSPITISFVGISCF